MVGRRDYIHNANRKQPQGELGLPPEPNGRAVAARPQWMVVRCPECGRVLCKATAGSTVKITCKRCKAESVTHAA